MNDWHPRNNILVPLLILFAVLVFPITMIFPRRAEPTDWEPIGKGIETKCDHGNRLYAKEGSMGVVTIAIAPNTCGLGG